MKVTISLAILFLGVSAFAYSPVRQNWVRGVYAVAENQSLSAATFRSKWSANRQIDKHRMQCQNEGGRFIDFLVRPNCRVNTRNRWRCIVRGRVQCREQLR